MKRWLSIAIAVLTIVSTCGAKIVYFPPKWDEDEKLITPNKVQLFLK